MEGLFNFFSKLLENIAALLRAPVEGFARAFAGGSMDGYFADWYLYVIPILVIGFILDIFFHVQRWQPLKRRKVAEGQGSEPGMDEMDGFEDFNDVSIYDTQPDGEPSAVEIAALMESTALTAGYKAEGLYSGESIEDIVKEPAASIFEGEPPEGVDMSGAPDAKVYRMNRSAATDPWYRGEEPELDGFPDGEDAPAADSLPSPEPTYETNFETTKEGD